MPALSPGAKSTPLTYTPSVQASPVAWPACISTAATMRLVVVLPLVPVTAINGTRERDPGGNNHAMNASAAAASSGESSGSIASSSGASSRSTNAAPDSCSGMRTSRLTTVSASSPASTPAATRAAAASSDGCVRSVTTWLCALAPAAVRNTATGLRLATTIRYVSPSGSASSITRRPSPRHAS